MRSGNLSRRFLARSLVVVLFALQSSALGKATNLEFYQDVEPERTADIANSYDEISRRLVLEAEKDAAPKLPWEYANYLKMLRRQKEKELLEALLDNPSLLNDALESSRASRTKESSNFPYSPLERYEADVTNDDDDEQSRRRYAASDRFQDYVEPGISGYARNIFRNENKPRFPQRVPSPGAYRPLMRMMPRPDNEEEAGDENYPVTSYRGRIPDQALAAGLEEKLARMNGGERRDLVDDQTRPRVPEHRQSVPDFTYRFDEPKNDDDDAFAVRPNDPRYYETRREPPMETLVTMRAGKSTSTTLDGKESSSDARQFDTTDLQTPSTTEYSKPDDTPADKFSIVEVSLPEMQRTEHESVSASRIMNNDIYFIAIVAGCSAAAMFALVLISLTWCRHQRGAKAAADIEYPAYGVTGPNKDVSPSGDQRLAHSAQMYHFQHQKQQIIAMENRTASSRDPGSVSEAESDEENEEGDYTVYECPGLASAGEMEVKNPMFHDDPTSATSPHINHNKEEDHI